ncbi:hypothetical protein MPER_02254, partial [Moniliophthora perniciosa FA553]
MDMHYERVLWTSCIRFFQNEDNALELHQSARMKDQSGASQLSVASEVANSRNETSRLFCPVCVFTPNPESDEERAYTDKLKIRNKKEPWGWLRRFIHFYSANTLMEHLLAHWSYNGIKYEREFKCFIPWCDDEHQGKSLPVKDFILHLHHKTWL